jgi:hypothetical protein
VPVDDSAGGGLPEVKPEASWENGFWRGPRDVRAFVRANRGFPWFYMLFYTAIFGVIISVEIGSWYAFPIGGLPAAALTFLQAFLFSRGWLGNGGGD